MRGGAIVHFASGQLYEVSSRPLELFSRYSANTMLSQTAILQGSKGHKHIKHIKKSYCSCAVHCVL